MIARKQQGDIDRNAREDRFFDRGKSLERAGDLDEQVGRSAFWKRGVRRARFFGVVGQQRRDLQRDQAVDGGGTLVDRREQVGGARQILHRQFEEQRFAREARTDQAANFGIVGFALGNSVVEDRRDWRSAP